MSYREAVFSEYQVKQIGVKVGNAETATVVDCVGTMNQTMEVRTVVKNCRGVPAKQRTRGTGSGTLDLTLHIPWSLYVAMYGMDVDGLIDGVAAYGTESLHPEMVITALVEDEDGNEMYKAFPKTTLTSGPSPQITNGAEEVAEISMQIAVSPDESGYGLYQAVTSDLADGTAKTDWMSKFTPALVKASA